MKNPKAPLERKRPLLLAAGFLFAISVTLVSFEWRTPYQAPVIPEWGGEIAEGPTTFVITLPEPKKKVDEPEPPKVEEKTTEFIISDEPIENNINEDPLIPEKLEDLPSSEFRTAEPDAPDVDLGPADWASVMPEFCEGEEAMFKVLRDNLKYPRIPLDNGVSGTVHIRFVVGKDGSLRDAKVVRPIDQWLDAEALRVAKLLKCFTPGKQGGRNVDVYFVLPVKFQLMDR